MTDSAMPSLKGPDMKIIDSHTHLGNILYPNGRELIYKTNVTKAHIDDPMDLSEKLLMRHFGLGKLIYKLSQKSITKAQVARGMTATLENMKNSLDRNQVSYSVCMPIAPYLTFEDLLEAKKYDSRIIPFTSIDFDKEHDVGKKLAEDVSNGAMGLKLHPIIQCQPVCGRPTMEALQSFQKQNRPVLVHAGPSSYYGKSEAKMNQPKNGNVSEIIELVRTFPNIQFIIGHAGLFWVKEIRKALHDCENTWVDTSFQPPSEIRKLVKCFGLGKVLYASDWPWGNQGPHIASVKAACKGDQYMEKRIYSENAKELLGLT
jgi:predicted TIM-barrel fold metal-dependent hydrolase